MSQKTASRTALVTAHMRAAHQLLDPPPRILEDPVAVAVLGPGFTTVELLTPSVAQDRYFRGSSLPSPQRTTIVAAVR